MIKDNVVKDAMEKIVLNKKTIQEVAPVQKGEKTHIKLRKKLRKIIKEGLEKALTKYSDQQVLAWNKEWKPNWTRAKMSREKLLKVPVEIKGMSNITVDNLMHANDDIKNKLENFIKEFEEPAPETVKTTSEVAFPEKVGVLRWKASSTRNKVYKYWEQVSKQFDKLKTQTDKWIETLNKKEGDVLKDTLDRLENYVIEVELEEIPVYDHVDIFDAILDELSGKKVARGGGQWERHEKVRQFAEQTTEEVAEVDDSSFQNTLLEASTKMDKIDPLLAVALSNGLTKLGFSKETLESQKRDILMNANRKLPEKIREKFIKKLDELTQDIGEVNTDFYLPDTQFTSKNESETDAMWKKHEEYLKQIHTILFKEGSRAETGSPRATADEYERFRGQDIFVEGREAEQKPRKKINPVLLDVIKEYYGPVSRSNTYFMGEPPKFMDSSILDDIYSLDGETGLDFDKGLVSAKQIEKLAKFVSNYRKGKNQQYDENTKDLAYTVWGILDKLFKGKHRDANKESIGWFLNKNNAPEGEKFMGESIKELAEKYEKGGRTVYPIMAMEGLINSPKFINLFN